MHIQINNTFVLSALQEGLYTDEVHLYPWLECFVIRGLDKYNHLTSYVPCTVPETVG